MQFVRSVEVWKIMSQSLHVYLLERNLLSLDATSELWLTIYAGAKVRSKGRGIVDREVPK